MNVTSDTMNLTLSSVLTTEVLTSLLNLTLGNTDTPSLWPSTSSLPLSSSSSTSPTPVKTSGGHPLVRQHMVRTRPASTPSTEDIWAVPPQDVLPVAAWTTFQVIHTIMTIVALAVNCTSLGVIYGIVAKLTPPLQLLTSLAFADMLAPWAIMTMYFPTSSCQDEIHTALLLTSHNASALTLLILAMCHNIATFRPLNYDKIVTQKRLWITINVIWITAILGAHIHFLAVLAHHRDSQLHFCIQVLHQTKMALSLSLAFLATTIIVSILIYARILLHLRPIRGLTNQGGVPRKSTRGVITGVILATLYLLAWLPYIITKFVNVNPGLIRDQGIIIGLNICQVFILMVNISDPLVYACRMSNMQSGYLSLYHKLRACCLITWYRLTNNGHHDEMPSTPLNPIESIC